MRKIKENAIMSKNCQKFGSFCSTEQKLDKNKRQKYNYIGDENGNKNNLS